MQPDPAGGARVQWVQLSLGIEPDSFSVKVNGREMATVPYVTGTIEYHATVAQACGTVDVVVVAVKGSDKVETAPFHAVLAACPWPPRLVAFCRERNRRRAPRRGSTSLRGGRLCRC